MSDTERTEQNTPTKDLDDVEGNAFKYREDNPQSGEDDVEGDVQKRR